MERTRQHILAELATCNELKDQYMQAFLDAHRRLKELEAELFGQGEETGLTWYPRSSAYLRSENIGPAGKRLGWIEPDQSPEAKARRFVERQRRRNSLV